MEDIELKKWKTIDPHNRSNMQNGHSIMEDEKTVKSFTHHLK